MNIKFFKSGILLILLGIPVFVFLFIKFFGSNNFDLPYVFPVVNNDGTVKMSAGDTVYNKLPSFEFIDQNDKLITNKSGEIKVISFFFSRCGTICPPTNKNLGRVQELFKDNSRVEIFSISIDPNYDSPAVLNKYASIYNADSKKWHFLTGNKKAIYDFAIKGCKVSVADAQEYDKTIKNIDEAFIHSDKILLVDKKGNFRGIYNSTDKADIDRLVLEIKILLKH